MEPYSAFAPFVAFAGAPISQHGVDVPAQPWDRESLVGTLLTFLLLTQRFPAQVDVRRPRVALTCLFEVPELPHAQQYCNSFGAPLHIQI